jgi:hypothetical protein
MSTQEEIFAMDKPEATALLIQKEAQRMQLETELEAQRELIKGYRDELKKINSQINDLTVICNKK